VICARSYDAIDPERTWTAYRRITRPTLTLTSTITIAIREGCRHEAIIPVSSRTRDALTARWESSCSQL
jgi:hypothetical protein